MSYAFDPFTFCDSTSAPKDGWLAASFLLCTTHRILPAYTTPARNQFECQSCPITRNDIRPLMVLKSKHCWLFTDLGVQGNVSWREQTLQSYICSSLFVQNFKRCCCVTSYLQFRRCTDFYSVYILSNNVCFCVPVIDKA